MEKTNREYQWVKWISYGAMIVWLVFLGVAYKASALENVAYSCFGSNSNNCTPWYWNSLGTWTQQTWIPAWRGNMICGVINNDIYYLDWACYWAWTQNCYKKYNTQTLQTTTLTIWAVWASCWNMVFDSWYWYVAIHVPSSSKAWIFKVDQSNGTTTKIAELPVSAPHHYIVENWWYLYIFAWGWSDNWSSYKIDLSNNNWLLVSNTNLWESNGWISFRNIVWQISSDAVEFFPTNWANKWKSSSYNFKTWQVSLLDWTKYINDANFWWDNVTKISWSYLYQTYSPYVRKINTFSPFSYDTFSNNDWTRIATYHFVTSYIPFASCTDWQINQDETEIDYGGVCGTCYDWIQQTNVTNPELGIDYGGRCEAKTGPVSYKWCETVKQYVSGTGSTNLMFWYVTTPSVTYMYTQSWSQWYNNESVAVYNGTANRDIVELYNFQYPWAQVIQTWSIVFDWTTQSKIITPTNWNAQMFIMSIRSSNTQKFNFLKFWGAVSSISTVGNIDNHVWEVEFNVPWFWSSKAPLVMSWGTAVAYTKNGALADSAIITFDRSSKFFQFSSFGIYSLSSFYSITNCWNGSYSCENVYRGNDTFACARNPRAWVGTAISEPWFSWATAIGTIWWSYSPSQYYSDVSCKVWTATVPVIINTQWDLTTVSGPSCIPNKTDGTLTTKEWYQIDYTTNWSGAVTSVNVKPIPFDSKVMCAGDEYDWFSWSLKCVLKFFFYYYDKMTWTQEDTMKILSTAIQVWYTKWKQAPLDITLGTKPNEKPTNALALAGYNAWDRTASGTNGISQTYRLWKYALYILVTVVVISMMFYFLNRKQ